VTNLLTKQHHNLVTQFLDFKERTLVRIEKNNVLENRVAFLETCYAMKTPVMEAEFALDERSPLSLYDCLVPVLKEHRRFKINLRDKFNINDFKSQQKVKQLEWDLQKSRMPGLIEENEMLSAKVKQL